MVAERRLQGREAGVAGRGAVAALAAIRRFDEILAEPADERHQRMAERR